MYGESMCLRTAVVQFLPQCWYTQSLFLDYVKQECEEFLESGFLYTILPVSHSPLLKTGEVRV